MNAIGHIHTWIHDRVQRPAKVAKYIWRVDDKDSDGYLQSELEIEALRELLTTEDREELSKGWPVYCNEQNYEMGFHALCDASGISDDKLDQNFDKVKAAKEAGYKRVCVFLEKLVKLMTDDAYRVSFDKKPAYKLKSVEISYTDIERLTRLPFGMRFVVGPSCFRPATIRLGFENDDVIVTSKDLLAIALMRRDRIIDTEKRLEFDDVNNVRHTLHVHRNAPEELCVMDLLSK